MTKHRSNKFGTWHSLLVLLFIICLCTIGCSKSHSNTSPPCGDTCLLSKYTWKMDSNAIISSAGTFITNTNLDTLPWSTFTFSPTLTFTETDGDDGLYKWTGNTQIALIYPPDTSLFHFNETVSPTSLVLSTLRFQVHPQVDSTEEANSGISAMLQGLHDQFKVDTSKVTYVEFTFYYSPK
jgi:hypothetical protein